MEIFMQHLGFTRTSVKPDHALLTPDSFIRAPLPGFVNATCVVHISPAMGAAFTQYTVEASANSSFGPAFEHCSRFVFVLEGEVTLTVGKKKHVLKALHYAFIPANTKHSVNSQKPARVCVFEKPYLDLPGIPEPELIVADSRKVKSAPINNDPALQCRILIPEHPSCDFMVNTMTFDPGASLHLVETHVMEHGLLMLEGGGIYKLNENWYPVQKNDVIYMAPYCPQWFGALGTGKSEYLLYKDWSRHPLE
jgi:(S)-ureidoglycine aminohydrolase